MGRTNRAYSNTGKINLFRRYKNYTLTANSYSTTKKMHLLTPIIYSCKTLYMFRMVFPSIIRSSELRIQQRYMSNSCYYLLLSGMRWK
jgi:hypothetical protein